MYYPSYFQSLYPYNSYPYPAYPMSNGYDVYPVSNEVQYRPKRKGKSAIPQKEAAPEEVAITNGEPVSKEEPAFGEFISTEELVSQETPLSQKSDTFAQRLLDQLSQRKGETISIATSIKEIQGELEDVFPDYVLVNHDGQQYHIRLEGIVYIS